MHLTRTRFWEAPFTPSEPSSRADPGQAQPGHTQQREAGSWELGACQPAPVFCGPAPPGEETGAGQAALRGLGHGRGAQARPTVQAWDRGESGHQRVWD